MALTLTLGKRIASGIFLLLIFIVAVGLVGYWGLTGVLTVTEFSRKMDRLNLLMTSAESNTNRYLLSVLMDDQELHAVSAKTVSDRLAEGLKIVDEIKRESRTRSIDVGELDNAGKEMNSFERLFHQYRSLDDEKAQIKGSIRQTFSAILADIGKGVLKTEAMTVAANVLQTSMISYVEKPSDTAWSTVQFEMEKTGKVVQEWVEFVGSSSNLAELGADIGRQYQDLKGSSERYHSVTEDQQELKKAMEAHANNLNNMCARFVELSTKRMQKQTRASIWLMFGGVAIAVVIGMAYAFISVKSIVGKLKSVIHVVTEGSAQVSLASSSVSSASQQLAEGSSEQAASLEETSSSLEEMSAMTRQNADNASQANQLMAHASKVVDQANQSMVGLTSSMGEISRTSEETQKIIKTIDEIAFQTNLLALNAAVEAARAGEAGAGFAVVADEVRNLAMRAAEAAKNTAVLIEESAEKIKEGSSLVGTTNDNFRQVASTVKKAADLVGEIVAASQEQAQGIEQINQAVSEMNEVVQRNSANAEESASASAEMTAQAEQMMGLVASLAALIAGTESRDEKEKCPSVVNENRTEMAMPIHPSRKASVRPKLGNGKDYNSTPAVFKRASHEMRPQRDILPQRENDEDF